MRSVLAADGSAHPTAATEDGVVAFRARADKERAYPDLVEGRRCKLVVLAVETGGRWSDEAVAFVQTLAEAKARDA